MAVVVGRIAYQCRGRPTRTPSQPSTPHTCPQCQHSQRRPGTLHMPTVSDHVADTGHIAGQWATQTGASCLTRQAVGVGVGQAIGARGAARERAEVGECVDRARGTRIAQTQRDRARRAGQALERRARVGARRVRARGAVGAGAAARRRAERVDRAHCHGSIIHSQRGDTHQQLHGQRPSVLPSHASPVPLVY
jgi:hypothetical protein